MAKSGFALWIFLFITISTVAWAEVGDDPDMAAASSFVQKLESFNENALLSADTVRDSVLDKIGLARFYKPGDRWVVATSYVSHGMDLREEPQMQLIDRFLEPAFYEFKVVEVSSGKAKINVLRIEPDGKPFTGPGSRQASFVFDSQLTSVPTGFQTVPIDLPDLSRSKVVSESHSHIDDRTIPNSLKSYVNRHPFQRNQAIELESYDMLLRSIRMVWQKGDLWPSRVETPRGYSILIQQEKI